MAVGVDDSASGSVRLRSAVRNAQGLRILLRLQAQRGGDRRNSPHGCERRDGRLRPVQEMTIGIFSRVRAVGPIATDTIKWNVLVALVLLAVVFSLGSGRVELSLSAVFA